MLSSDVRKILAMDSGEVLYDFPLSCYFDDFVSFSPPTAWQATHRQLLCLMLDVLGWGFDKEGPKSDDYLPACLRLGGTSLICAVARTGCLERLQYREKGVKETTNLAG